MPTTKPAAQPTASSHPRRVNRSEVGEAQARMRGVTTSTPMLLGTHQTTDWEKSSSQGTRPL